jgi:hypothetical protein
MYSRFDVIKRAARSSSRAHLVMVWRKAPAGSNDLFGQCSAVHHGPEGSMTVVKTMAGEVHRDVHHHQEHTDAGGEQDLESSGESIAGCLIVRIGHRLYSYCLW